MKLNESKNELSGKFIQKTWVSFSENYIKRCFM